MGFFSPKEKSNNCIKDHILTMKHPNGFFKKEKTMKFLNNIF